MLLIQLINASDPLHLNCASSSYSKVKLAAEETRNWADADDFAALSASQLKIDGYNNLNPTMQHTAGSSGLNDVADLMITISKDETMDELSLYIHNILKSRFGPNSVQFYSMIEKEYMRVRSAADDLIEKYKQMADEQSLVESSPSTGKRGATGPKKKPESRAVQNLKMGKKGTNVDVPGTAKPVSEIQNMSLY